MPSFKNGTLTWDLQEVSRALRLTADDARSYFTDGRRVSFVLERRLAYEVVKGTLAPSEGAGYDLIDPSGKKWEVRSITSNVYFCPSYMVGKGRQFEEAGFLQKLDEVAGYILSDVQSFPVVPFWIVDTSVVRRWWNQGQLGKNSFASRTRILKLLNAESLKLPTKPN